MAGRSDGLKRRNELLDAALACFVERGVLATGIEEIRKKAGASPSSVYHLFGGFPGVVAALLERTFQRLFEHLAARVVPTGSAEEAVKALVDGHLEWVLTHRDEARFMYQAMASEGAASSAPSLPGAKAKWLAPVTATFARHIAAGTLPDWPTLHFDVVLLGPAHEACRRYLAGAALKPAWMRAVLPELAWNAVRAAQAPGRSGRRPSAK